MTPSSPTLTFRGGLAGALAPMAFFLAGVTTLAFAGAPDERGFWPVLLGAWMIGLLLAHDRAAWSDVAIAAIAQPIVAIMVLAWLLAGAFGAILGEAGMVDGIVQAALRIGVGPVGVVAVAFLACALVSTATGTSFGTLLVAGPVVYGAGRALGADGPVLMGAVLAGATWGDSISPISDTSIASAGSQNTDVAGTVRSRLPYVVPAGLVAMVASVALATRCAPGAATVPTADPSASPTSLLLLIAPAVVIAMLLRRRPLLEGLITGIALALVLGVGTGRLPLASVLRIDRAAYGARGVLVDGLGRGVGVSVFTILLMGLVGTVQASGALTRLLDRPRASAESPRGAEWRIVALLSGAVLLTTHSVVAILAVGPLAGRLGAAAGLGAYRRANLLDLTACTWPFLLPWFLPTILAAGATGGSGLERLSPLTVGLHNTYAWALALTVPLAILTGYGRQASD